MIKLLKSLLQILTRREKKQAIRIILLDIIISLLDIGFLILLLYVIRFYANESANSGSTYYRISVFKHYPLLLIILFFLLFSAKNIFGFYIFSLQLKFVYHVASRLSNQNLDDYLEGNFSDYIHTDSSVFIHKTSHQPIEFSHYVLTGVQQIISQSVLIGLTVAAVLYYNAMLFMLLIVILSPAVITAAYLMKKKLSSIRNKAKPLGQKAIQNLKEALAAFVESNLFQKKEFFSSRYYTAQSNFNNILSSQLIMQNMPSRLIEVFAVLGLLMLIVTEILSGKTGSVQFLTIGAFMAAAYKVIPGIVKILASSGQIKTYRFTVDDLLRTGSSKLPVINKNLRSPESISFVNVSFSFGNSVDLKNISFHIAKGDFIGISGLSGNGKTTLINLILGFLSPHSGSILFNDTETEADQRKDFWKLISYVKQQPLLIYDSILKNITLDDAIYDFKKLQEVIKVTGLEGIIKNYPEGFNKIVTENGKNISGGQRKRIAIARALYKNADLIILDEPFSELDRYSEDCLLTYFSELANKGKIVILITHNQESLLFCTKIISLDEKQPAGFGDIDAWLS